MRLLIDDAVIVKLPEKEGEPSIITVNCPDKTGLGSDLCRIILFFRLTLVRTDVSTDGRWCCIVFWVIGKRGTRWALLKKRLMGACPSHALLSGISYYGAELQPSKPPDVFRLTLCCHARVGLLHDVTMALCELELTIERVKVSTTPEGKVIDLFFITDRRKLPQTKTRKEDMYFHLDVALGGDVISCDIEMVDPEVTACSQGPSFLSDAITGDMFNVEALAKCRDDCLLYDVMRTLKDYNIQISYGRITTGSNTECEMDIFILQSNGKKIIDHSKQKALCTPLQIELSRPLRLAFLNRGPDTEFLVANPVELSGKGRPLVFYDITLALKTLNISIFSAEIGRYMISGREWEIYQVLLDEGEGCSISKNMIKETIWKMLMCWDWNFL